MNYFKIGSEMGFLNVNIVLLYILHNILNQFNGKKIKFSVLETQDLSIHLCFFHDTICSTKLLTKVKAI